MHFHFLAREICESRLRWYGHVMRRPKEHMTRTVLDIEPGLRGRGRPRDTWASKINQDLKPAQLDPQTTQERMAWRRMIRRADPN